jgi:hypothetical protein
MVRWIALGVLAVATGQAADPIPGRPLPAPAAARRGWFDPTRFSANYTYESHRWRVREYDNVWILSHLNPGENTEARYLNRKALIEGQFVALGYELTDRVSVQARAGTMTGGERKTNVVPGEYDPESAWGAGFNARLWEMGEPDVRVTAAFRYNAGKSSDWSRLNTPYEGDIQEWHLDLLGSLAIPWRGIEFAFLAGASYSDLQLPYRHTTDRPDRPIREGGYEAEDSFGGVIGIECRVASRFEVSVRGREGATRGLTAAAGVNF